MAEYKAMWLRVANERVVKAEHLMIKSGSKLVVNQIRGTFEIRDLKMRKYFDRTNSLISWKKRAKDGNFIIYQELKMNF